MDKSLELSSKNQKSTKPQKKSMENSKFEILISQKSLMDIHGDQSRAGATPAITNNN